MTEPSWLQLLLDGASVDELEAHRCELLGQNCSDDVETQARQALQLHALLHDRAQRAVELGALSKMATRLTAVRDVPELLTHIAVLTRQLLNTDVAYLALVEGDCLRIRYFDGTLGVGWRDIKLTLTGGIAGRVLTTGKPRWTNDYLNDRTIQHDAAADEFAGDEQLRSILGVPLHAQGETFGVLFAAERSQRSFSASEISLLAGLAGNGAVAIQNARLFDAERALSGKLRASAALVDREVALHERLTDTAVRGGGPAEVVQALAEVLHVPVQLVDPQDVSLAGPDLGVESPSRQIPPGQRRTVVLPAEDGEIVLLCPVVAAEDYLGCLVVGAAAQVDDAELRLLERGALGLALSLVQERALTDAEARNGGDLLTALVEGGEAPLLERRAAAVHVDLRHPHVVALVEPDDAGSQQAAEVTRRAGGITVARAGRQVLLVREEVDLSALARTATVGVSAPFTGAADVPEAFAVARRCLQALLAMGRQHTVGGPGAFGIYGFLLAHGGADEAAEFVRQVVGPLVEHDRTRGSDLARTLEEYLGSGRQHAATAERLHIHPNTLYQRLDRVSSVIGEQWRERDAALDLLVALRLHRLAGEL